ncbi:MAG TPA: acyltransferase [Vitreimonas sp.]|uniref:acyltransferase family protein n=1 Tax=Vitreimonas sp. TaxID=3069702 RepID=UPI002D30589F|nr:acyltransferase [Vitreimonas sp.]HYD87884.1 acyltransferase [Vitreimonas sp.]
MTRFAYPQELKPLTSLRFIAAFWVLLYHFKDHLGLDVGRLGLVADGYLGVDLFFTLSGFILAHVYLTSLEERRFGYGGFLKNRIARVYPMHLAALAAMIVLFAGASAVGAGVGSPEAFKWSDLPAHLLMVHAWGATEAVGWNFPSWSISAEWAAYLLFPLIAALVVKAQRWSAAVALGALTLCVASFWALSNLHQALPWVGRDFSQMTAQIGALRILPSFLLGVALYAFGRDHAAPKSWAWPIVAASAGWIVAVTTLGWWEGLVWFGLAGLLYGLAETSRHGVDAPMSGRAFVFLGAASYALYMIHLPIDIVWFHALERLGVTETSDLTLRIGAMVGVFAVCIIVSAFAYLWLEEPARKWIRKLELPQYRKAKAAEA